MLEHFTTAQLARGRKAGWLKYTHLVLYVDDKKANRLNDEAIIIRWYKVCKGTLLTKKYLQGEKLTKAELIFFNQIVKQYRERLSSISWFMRLLNEDIVRKANKEDNCTGRFYSLPSMTLTLRVA